MKKIACIGNEAFTLGFQLAGIRETIKLDEKGDVLDKINDLKNNILSGRSRKYQHSDYQIQFTNSVLKNTFLKKTLFCL